MTRAEKVAAITTLAERDHLTIGEAGARLGFKPQTARNLVADPDGAKQRERRKRYQGTCKHCGAATDGSNGKRAAPDVCLRCLPTDPDWLAAMTYWTPERIIEAIRYWNAKYGEPPAVADWDTLLPRRMHDPERAARYKREQEAGKVPSCRVVYNKFPSWNAAIQAAGFEPRAAHGGSGNQYRRRLMRAKAKAAA